MIAVERPAPAVAEEARLDGRSAPLKVARGARRMLLTSRLSAAILAVALLASLGGGGLLDLGGAYVLQARAQTLHDRWQAMRVAGIPDTDLAGLEREWAATQAIRASDR